MKKLLVLLVFWGMVMGSYAQFQAANWPVMYNNLMLKITPGNFEKDSLPSGHSFGFLANASISDSLGNLLFFSFGLEIVNKQGDTMDNGCCLGESIEMPFVWAFGSASPHMQGAMILPKPGSNSQYYLFIKDMEVLPGQPTRVTESLIDMSYNGGLGKALWRNMPILNDTLSDSRMTACKHANGRDWWLVNHQSKTNRIYTHLITPDSIYGPFNQNIGAPGIEPDAFGWSLFSQDGSLFVTVTSGMSFYDRRITLLDFDRCSGIFSNYRILTTDTLKNSSFLALSHNDRFLYSGNNRYLYQYDLQSADIASSCVLLVHDTVPQPALGMMVLMPNNKIYVAGWTGSSNYISVIDSPDLKYPDCGFHLRSVYVPNSILIGNVPNFPNYNLGALVGSGCDTLTGLNETTRAAKEKEIKVFPNPAADYVTVDYGFTDWNKGDVRLTICDVRGVAVYEQQLPRYSGFQKINVSSFSSGFYTAFIKRSSVTVATAKFAKQ